MKRSPRTPTNHGVEWLTTEGPRRKVPKTSAFDEPQRMLHQQRLDSYFAAARNVAIASRAVKTKSSDHSLPERKRVVSCTVVSGECDSPPPLEIFQFPLQVASVAREPAAATATITSSFIAASQGPAHTVTSADLAAPTSNGYFAPQKPVNTSYFSPQQPAFSLRPVPAAYLLPPQGPTSYFRTQATHNPTSYFTPQSETAYSATTQHTSAASKKKNTSKKAKKEKQSLLNFEFEQVGNEMINVATGDEFDIENCNEDSLGLGEAVNEQEADVSLIVDFALGTNNRQPSDPENKELELDFTFDSL